MTYLLDTHVWLLLRTAPGRVDTAVRERLEDPDVDLLLSAASVWEIAIKYALGKLELPEAPGTYVPSRMRSDGVGALPITYTHALRVASLPFHHRDPFDRLLVAQAQVDALVLVTRDRVLERYEVDVLRA